MKFGGWTRLGIVASVLYGIIIIVDAILTLPDTNRIYDYWFDDASIVIASAVSAREGLNIPSYEVRNSTLNKGNEENIKWLRKAASFPSENQKIFSKELQLVNDKYEKELNMHPSKQMEHCFFAFLWWAGGTLALFASGSVIGWIYRGFKQDQAKS